MFISAWIIRADEDVPRFLSVYPEDSG